MTFAAEPVWMLMSRHGGCVELGVLKRKIPEIAAIKSPAEFIKLMRDTGYSVSVQEVAGETAKAVVVEVPARELSLIFATQEMCRSR